MLIKKECILFSPVYFKINFVCLFLFIFAPIKAVLLNVFKFPQENCQKFTNFTEFLPRIYSDYSEQFLGLHASENIKSSPKFFQKA